MLGYRVFFSAAGPAGLLLFLWATGVRVYYAIGSFILLLLASLCHGGLLFRRVFYLAGQSTQHANNFNELAIPCKSVLNQKVKPLIW